MIFFYLTNFHQKEGVHEIHAQGCPQMPGMLELTYLGPFNNPEEAVRKAKVKYDEVKTCPECCQSKKMMAIKDE
ncbi:hypothetical protein QWY93_12070 [Echinicola jeungdonensis]|uniref:SPOR domain-containing protein n=1 Tax=Echinicola jeungdonensis TaxID=709343 RepID=A0ABV5J482_9BACT|nr:hypothetical protein [Echinicola jeungdonensis]MDN3670060.1 hypothetical protein [Echinicola jeungdonensis]